MAEDDYEARYLGADDAIHREKRTSRTVFALTSTIATLLGGLGTIGMIAGATGDPQGLIVGAGMLGLAAFVGVLGITESVGRVVVAPGELRVSHGLRDTRIPLSSVSSTALGTFDAQVKFKAAADRARVFGPSKVGDGYVRVAWTDASGTAHVGWIASDDPEALRAAIERARLAPGSAVRVMVQDEPATQDAELEPRAEPREEAR
ncbi:MAG: hypothetical protein M3Y87_13730 [Myxococcota bacterium]|nr:hypothetical protein [Myxococcota bacterium]